MTLIEVQAPFEKAQDITVNHARYSKTSTAGFLAQRALEVSGTVNELDRSIQHYPGNEEQTRR